MFSNYLLKMTKIMSVFSRKTVFLLKKSHETDKAIIKSQIQFI